MMIWFSALHFCNLNIDVYPTAWQNRFGKQLMTCGSRPPGGHTPCGVRRYTWPTACHGVFTKSYTNSVEIRFRDQISHQAVNMSGIATTAQSERSSLTLSGHFLKSAILMAERVSCLLPAYRNNLFRVNQSQHRCFPTRSQFLPMFLILFDALVFTITRRKLEVFMCIQKL